MVVVPHRCPLQSILPRPQTLVKLENNEYYVFDIMGVLLEQAKVLIQPAAGDKGPTQADWAAGAEVMCAPTACSGPSARLSRAARPRPSWV